MADSTIFIVEHNLSILTTPRVTLYTRTLSFLVIILSIF